MSAGRRLGAIAAAVATGVVLLAAPALPVRTTEAAWTESDAGTGGFTALSVPAARSLSCTQQGNALLGYDARLDWLAPASGLPANSVYRLILTNLTSGATSQIDQSATTRTLSDGLLGGLLSGLLAGNATVRVQVFVATTYGSTVWTTSTSPQIDIRYEGGLLSGNFLCP